MDVSLRWAQLEAALADSLPPEGSDGSESGATDNPPPPSSARASPSKQVRSVVRKARRPQTSRRSRRRSPRKRPTGHRKGKAASKHHAHSNAASQRRVPSNGSRRARRPNSGGVRTGQPTTSRTRQGHSATKPPTQFTQGGAPLFNSSAEQPPNVISGSSWAWVSAEQDKVASPLLTVTEQSTVEPESLSLPPSLSVTPTTPSASPIPAVIGINGLSDLTARMTDAETYGAIGPVRLESSEFGVSAVMTPPAAHRSNLQWDVAQDMEEDVDPADLLPPFETPKNKAKMRHVAFPDFPAACWRRLLVGEANVSLAPGSPSATTSDRHTHDRDESTEPSPDNASESKNTTDSRGNSPSSDASRGSLPPRTHTDPNPAGLQTSNRLCAADSRQALQFVRDLCRYTRTQLNQMRALVAHHNTLQDPLTTGEHATGSNGNTQVPSTGLLLQKKDREIQRLRAQLARESGMRRRYFDQIMCLRGNVRVYVRIRPLLVGPKRSTLPHPKPLEPQLHLGRQFSRVSRNLWSDGEADVAVMRNTHSGPHRRTVSDGGALGVQHSDFSFQRVFMPRHAQAHVYTHSVKPLVQSAVDGWNVSVFAYGQTGAGKTYTMGLEHNTGRAQQAQLNERAGVTLRAIRDLFRLLNLRLGSWEKSSSRDAVIPIVSTEGSALERKGADTSADPAAEENNNNLLSADADGGMEHPDAIIGQTALPSACPFRVMISCVEIYQNRCVDLLSGLVVRWVQGKQHSQTGACGCPPFVIVGNAPRNPQQSCKHAWHRGKPCTARCRFVPPVYPSSQLIIGAHSVQMSDKQDCQHPHVTAPERSAATGSRAQRLAAYLNARHHHTPSALSRRFNIKDLSVWEATSVREAWMLVQEGIAQRKVRGTMSNERSSRSHLIVSFYVQGPAELMGTRSDRSSSAQGMGKMHFIDLAGSERVHKSGSEGISLEEARCINRSLTTLGTVIAARHRTQKNAASHVPYRDSKLTFFLQDSLSAETNSKTCMLLSVSPDPKDSSECLYSLQFGAQVAQVVTQRQPSQFSGHAPSTSVTATTTTNNNTSNNMTHTSTLSSGKMRRSEVKARSMGFGRRELFDRFDLQSFEASPTHNSSAAQKTPATASVPGMSDVGRSGGEEPKTTKRTTYMV